MLGHVGRVAPGGGAPTGGDDLAGEGRGARGERRTGIVRSTGRAVRLRVCPTPKTCRASSIATSRSTTGSDGGSARGSGLAVVVAVTSVNAGVAASPSRAARSLLIRGGPGWPVRVGGSSCRRHRCAAAWPNVPPGLQLLQLALGAGRIGHDPAGAAGHASRQNRTSKA